MLKVDVEPHVSQSLFGEDKDILYYGATHLQKGYGVSKNKR